MYFKIANNNLNLLTFIYFFAFLPNTLIVLKTELLLISLFFCTLVLLKVPPVVK